MWASMWRFLTDLCAYRVLRPYDLFPGFFLSSFALVVLVLALPSAFASWPGYTAFAYAGGSQGGGRFLIDASLPIALLYMLVIAARHNHARYHAVLEALRTNRVHRYPLIGAVFFIVQFPLLLLCYQRQDDFVYALSENFWVVAYCLPWFSYLAANSAVVILVRLQTTLAARSDRCA